MAGFAVFSVLGFMAHEQGVPIAEVAESGMCLGLLGANVTEPHGAIHSKGIPQSTGFLGPVFQCSTKLVLQTPHLHVCVCVYVSALVADILTRLNSHN